MPSLDECGIGQNTLDELRLRAQKVLAFGTPIERVGVDPEVLLALLDEAEDSTAVDDMEAALHELEDEGADLEDENAGLKREIERLESEVANLEADLEDALAPNSVNP